MPHLAVATCTQRPTTNMSNTGLKQYTVFLGAPSASSASSSSAYHWRVISFEATDDSSPESQSRSQQHAIFYPPATLAEASRRISVLYENIIFKDTSVGDYDSAEDERDDGDFSSLTRPGQGAHIIPLVHTHPLMSASRPVDHDHLGTNA